MDLFLLKKIVSIIIMPTSLVLIFLILSLIYFKGKPVRSLKFLVSAIVILIISSMPFMSSNFMAGLEDNYKTFTRSNKPVNYIIVLGGWHTNDDDLPATNQLNISSLQRLVEVLRIYKLHPEANIITSGHHNVGKASNAQKMKESLMLLGVPEYKIITENFPKDTEEEAQLISPRVRGSNVVLVTNASHMPRAMKYFQSEGVNPVAAPTGHWVKNINSPKGWSYYMPNSKSLQQTTAAWYETVGRLVQWIKSFIS